jgi:hypothetical protein
VLVSFLICGLHGRPWKELAESIQKQIDAAGVACEVLTNVDGGEKPSGQKRNELMKAASGEYVAFIDDDDTVSGEYVRKIASSVAEYKCDVISFSIRVNSLNKNKRSRSEVWRLGLWPDSRKRGVMAANHLCCWKKEIASLVPWCNHLGYADDQLWYKPLIASGYAKTFHEIEDCLYFYQYSSDGTQNQTSEKVKISRKHFGSGIRCFLVGGKIAIEDGCQFESPSIVCRSAEDGVITVDSSETPFCVVRMNKS